MHYPQNTMFTLETRGNPFRDQLSFAAPIATIGNASPIQQQIESACTFVAIQTNNGFGSNRTPSNPNGVVFSQKTQLGIREINPGAVQGAVLNVLASPSIGIQAAYQNCLAAFK